MAFGAKGLGSMGLGSMGLGSMGLGSMGLGSMGLVGLGSMGLGSMGLGSMGLGSMGRKSLIVGALAVLLGIGASGAVLASFTGPGPWITGNDTGGIIPYSPDLEGVYQQMAQDYCARWRRLSHITSVHRTYGDYISFVCIDKPWMIH